MGQRTASSDLTEVALHIYNQLRESLEEIIDFYSDDLSDCKLSQKISIRYGTGRSTHVESTYISSIKVKVTFTFGMKMIKDLIHSKATCLKWIQRREIEELNFFDGKITPQNLLVHTIFHEFAHLLSNSRSDYKQVFRAHRTPHDQNFYVTLREVHNSTIAKVVKAKLYEDNIFRNLEFTADSGTLQSHLTKSEQKIIREKLRKRDIITFVLDSHIFIGIVNRRNQNWARVLAHDAALYTAKEEISRANIKIYAVPYNVIVKVDTESDMHKKGKMLLSEVKKITGNQYF
ncbi:hypothetical protein [Photobacterium kishitanii]|uniref:Uncharacterized protein n=1 Tax=Photobacterium kishitanii TaxID=318456 RepID=A0A2T3KLQ3_9GAMM|nr:hypothetical protein [Photobacterium kishitanii]PSV00593.1 hypothetical protein C9J27_05510 [Photobacterium kishitanii]